MYKENPLKLSIIGICNFYIVCLPFSKLPMLISQCCLILDNGRVSPVSTTEAPHSEDIGMVYLALLMTMLVLMVILDLITITGMLLDRRRKARRHRLVVTSDCRWVAPPSYYRYPSQAPRAILPPGAAPPVEPPGGLPAYYKCKL